MAKHTWNEIREIFATHVSHTHEAAVKATYDAGYAQGAKDATEAAPAPTQESAPAGAPNGEDDGHAQTGEVAQGEAAPHAQIGTQEGESAGSGSGERQADAPG